MALNALQCQISESRQALQDDQKRHKQLIKDVQEAIRMQQLRRELDALRAQRKVQQEENTSQISLRFLIDQDLHGNVPDKQQFRPHYIGIPYCSGEGVVNVTTRISSGEYLWKIMGMSWLQDALQMNRVNHIFSQDFCIGSTLFDLVYAPCPVPIDNAEQQMGTLAIRHREKRGVVFRYKMLIQKAGGDFVQWGEDGHECYPCWTTEDKAFGPDVHTRDSEWQGFGVFGLTHAQLLESNWIEDDTLTVKVQMKVMEESHTRTVDQLQLSSVEVPPPDIAAKLLSMYEKGQMTDVTFSVDGQQFKAHAIIISAMSEVLRTVLNSGMSESASRVVSVEEVDAGVFDMFLRYLYTDDLDLVATMLKAKVAEELSWVAHNEEAVLTNVRPQILKNMHSVSHRYQVERLRLWCEQELCHEVCKDEVLSLLCHAYLLEAVELQKTCLVFIKSNQEAVVAMPAFGKLSVDWPEVMLEINVFLAGISYAAASSVFAAQKEARNHKSIPEGVVHESSLAAKRQRIG